MLACKPHTARTRPIGPASGAAAPAAPGTGLTSVTAVGSPTWTLRTLGSNALESVKPPVDPAPLLGRAMEAQGFQCLGGIISPFSQGWYREGMGGGDMRKLA